MSYTVRLGGLAATGFIQVSLCHMTRGGHVFGAGIAIILKKLGVGLKKAPLLLRSFPRKGM
jgi:hypothetical protein